MTFVFSDGSVGSLDKLRNAHAIPVFDDRVLFREFAAVRGDKLAAEFAVDEETGLCDVALPSDVTIREHVYFLDGQVVTSPSMTGFLKLYFPESFDAEAQSLQIAIGNRILNDVKYKYYQWGRAMVEEAWVAAGNALEDAVAAYETDESSLRNPSTPAEVTLNYYEFRALHDKVVREGLKVAWAANGRLQSGLGKTMHRSIELFYNDCELAPERTCTVEYNYFLDFHREWAEKRGLAMYRTELSMCYFEIKLCGMIDAMYVYKKDLASGKPVTRCVLVDWKRAGDLQFESFAKRTEKKNYDGTSKANAPFEHLELCDGSKYYAQLNGYKCTLEKHTPFRVESMHLAVFHPNNSQYNVFDVPDLQPQFAQCIETAKRAQTKRPAPDAPQQASAKRAAGAAASGAATPATKKTPPKKALMRKPVVHGT